MSIENISRLYTKGEKNVTYIFDLPSLEDDEAIVSYSLVVSKDGKINISKLTDFNDLFSKLKDSRAVPIKFRSKEYDIFIQKMYEYMVKIGEIEINTELDDEDINIINSQYENELKKKGNTDILKRKLK